MLKKIIESGAFAIILGLAIFVAQEEWKYSYIVKIILVIIFTIVVVYLFYGLLKAFRSLFFFSKYDVVADIEDYQLIISSSCIDAKIYHALTNKSKNVVRTINYDYDGGNYHGTIFPKYFIHSRSQLLNGKISPIGNQEGIVLQEIHEYGEDKRIYYSEWGLDLKEPLQPNESISYSRHYARETNEKIVIDEINEFSFRTRFPAKKFSLSIYCIDLSLSSQEVYATNQSGKKLRNISFESNQFSLKVNIECLEPSERVVIRFFPKHV